MAVVGDREPVFLVLVDVGLGRLPDPQLVLYRANAEGDVHVPHPDGPLAIGAQIGPHPVHARHEVADVQAPRVPVGDVGRLRRPRAVVADARVHAQPVVGDLPLEVGLHHVELPPVGRHAAGARGGGAHVQDGGPEVASEQQAVRERHEPPEELGAAAVRHRLVLAPLRVVGRRLVVLLGPARRDLPTEHPLRGADVAQLVPLHREPVLAGCAAVGGQEPAPRRVGVAGEAGRVLVADHPRIGAGPMRDRQKKQADAQRDQEAERRPCSVRSHFPGPMGRVGTGAVVGVGPGGGAS